MTMPPEKIQVKCPKCQTKYDDWYRPSINLGLDNFNDDYVRSATTATCPKCNTVVELGSLIVGRDGVWRVGPGGGSAEGKEQ